MAANPWSGLTKAYLGQRVARRALSIRSRREYAYVLADFADYLAGQELPIEADLETIVVAVDDWLRLHHWSAATQCTNLGIVRPFFDWAARRGHVAVGVAGELRNPRKPPPLPRSLSPRQMAALLAVVPDERGRAIVFLEGQCGLRRAEVAGLRLADADLFEGEIRVRGKGGKERMVYPSEETVEALQAWEVVRGPGRAWEPLICHLDDTARPLTPTWIGILVARWMRDAGLKARPGDGISGHALRHTTATEMLRSGANIRVVQNALGHASITTTAGYLRATDPEVKQAMRKLSYGRRRLAAIDGDAG